MGELLVWWGEEEKVQSKGNISTWDSYSLIFLLHFAFFLLLHVTTESFRLENTEAEGNRFNYKVTTYSTFDAKTL